MKHRKFDRWSIVIILFVLGVCIGAALADDPRPETITVARTDSLWVGLIGGSVVIGVSPGDDEWMIAYAEPGGPSFGVQCRELAEAVCTKGKICSLKLVVGADGQECEFTCRDEHGNCPGSPATTK